MSKKSLYVLLTVLSCKVSLTAAPVFAPQGPYNKTTETTETATTSSSTALPLKTWHSRFEAGGNYTRLNLKPRGSSSFNGNLGGAQTSYEYRPKNSFYGGAFFSWKEGDTHGASGKRSILYLDGQERMGYTFASEQRDHRLTLFTGLGFRYLGQKFTPKTGDPLKFRYHEFYVPLGFLTDFTVTSWFALGVDFTWMPQVFPTVSIIPLHGAHWTLINKLKNFYVDLNFDFTLTKNRRFHLIFIPFYERWQDGHSTAKTPTGLALGLPSNTYNFWGANLNFGYCF